MLHLLQKAKGRYIFNQRKNQKQKIDQFTARYIRENKLEHWLQQADASSASTGAELYDYVTLHSYIRTKKPTYVLECGTGKTTWIIADALHKNFTDGGVKGKVISMESIEKWYEEAKRIFPKELDTFVEIHYSPATTYMYSFIKGTAFTKVPDYPYDFVFVDGPELTITDDGQSYETVNMDFIRYIKNTDRKVTAVVDSRLRTCVAYGVIFGKQRMKFYKPWMVGVIENVSGKDMLINEDGERLNQLLQQTTSHQFAEPSWLKSLVYA